MAKKLDKETELIIINKYLKGTGCTTISRELKISPTTVHRVLKRNNIDSRNHSEASKKYYFNENCFELIDNEFKAYWLGFIYADGAIIQQKYANTLKIDLSSIDIEHLYKLKECMDSDVGISVYNTSGGFSNNTEYARFIITSDKICKDLESHGVYYNKTLILDRPNINKKLIRHFIRGYIDGDGCITSYMPKGKKRTYSIKIVGTLNILDFIKEYIEDNTRIKIKKYHYRNEKSKVASIEIGGNLQVQEVLNLIYGNSNIYLSRKYNLYLEVLKNNSPMQ